MVDTRTGEFEADYIDHEVPTTLAGLSLTADLVTLTLESFLVDACDVSMPRKGTSHRAFGA